MLILTILGYVGLAITVITILATTWRNGRNTSTLADYREAALASDARANALKAQVDELQLNLLSKDKELAVLKQQVLTLRDMVTGKSDLAEMNRKFEDLVIKMNEQVGEALHQASAIRTELRGLRSDLNIGKKP
jgi:chromosome segregation ATPase